MKNSSPKNLTMMLDNYVISASLKDGYDKAVKAIYAKYRELIKK
jgi:hypothetical protein